MCNLVCLYRTDVNWRLRTCIEINVTVISKWLLYIVKRPAIQFCSKEHHLFSSLHDAVAANEICLHWQSHSWHSWCKFAVLPSAALHARGTDRGDWKNYDPLKICRTQCMFSPPNVLKFSSFILYQFSYLNNHELWYQTWHGTTTCFWQQNNALLNSLIAHWYDQDLWGCTAKFHLWKEQITCTCTHHWIVCTLSNYAEDRRFRYAQNCPRA